MNPKFCSQCGAPLGEDARFCSQCGTPILREGAPAPAVTPEPTPIYDAPAQVSYAPTPKPKKEKNPQKRAFVRNIITKSVCLALAILFVVLAFLPIFSRTLEVDLGEGIPFKAEIKLSAIDTLILFANTFQSQSELQLMESPLVEKLESQAMQLGTMVVFEQSLNYNTLSREAKSLIQDILFTTLLLAARSDEVGAPIVMYVACALCVAYVLLTVALLVLAILSFIGAFGIGRLGSKKLERALYLLMTIIPVLAIALPLAHQTTIPDLHATYALILPLILSLAFLVWVMISRILFEKLRFSVKTLVVRSVSTALCVLVLCLVSAPILRCRITTAFKGQSQQTTTSITFDYEDFTAFQFGEKDLEKYDDFYNYGDKSETAAALQENKDGFSAFKYTQMKGDDASSHNEELLAYLLAAYNAHHFGFFFSLVSLFAVLAILCAALLLQQNISYFIGGSYSRLAVLLTKILFGIFSLAMLALSIAFLVLISMSISNYGLLGYTVRISAGIILYMVFAIATICMPAKTKKKQSQVAAWFADVLPQ